MNETEPNNARAPEPERQEPQHKEFEQALTRALRRVDAPMDFAARVTALAEAEQHTSEAAGSRKPEAGNRRSWLSFAAGWGWKPAWGAMAAVLVAGVLAGHEVHERRVEQHARQQASREFDTSLQITDRALDHAREQLRRAGVALEPDGQ